MRKRRTNEQFQEQLDRVVQTLHEQIIDGTYAPGEYLPSEKALAAQFQLSNNSVRKGLEQLVREGWIEKVPRVGNRVTVGRTPVQLRLSCGSIARRNVALPGLLDDFCRQYPWIHVTMSRLSDMDSSDLMLLDDFQFHQIAERDNLHKLEPLEERPDIYPLLNSMFTLNQRLYMQPIIFSPVVLCYNKAHFRERGMLEPDGSWTWDDLMRHAERLSGGGRYGFSFHVPSDNRWSIFLMQSGERFTWRDGQLQDLRGTKLLDSLSLCKSIVHNRKAFPLLLSESNDDVDRLFLENKVSMTLNSMMGLNGWDNPEVDYDIAPVPRIDEMRTLVISLGAGINSGSQHKEEAALLLDYLTSHIAQEYIREHTLSIPSVGTLPTTPARSVMKRPERFGLYREIMASCRPLRDLGIPTASFGKLSQNLKTYWADMIDEDELCERIYAVLSEDRSRPEQENE